MKKLNFLQFVLIIFALILLPCCTGGVEKSSELDDSSQESNINQELELPQKRIVYQIPEMEDIVCHKDIVYLSTQGLDLKADIYLPPEDQDNEFYPLVILVNDYPDSRINYYWGRDQKDMELFVSWGELIAASGIAAVTYQTEFSHSETDSLISFLNKNAKKYKIDMNRICVFGASANTLAAQSLMENADYPIKCAIYYYGILLTPDQKFFAKIDTVANSVRFYWSDLRPITSIPLNIPILVTQAGKDIHQIVTETTDHFVSEAIKSKVPLTYIYYPEGQHDFDILDNTQTSKLIIRQTIDFLKTHLF